MRRSKWDAWWLDLLMAALLFASAQVIVLGVGHGIGFMGNLLLEAPVAMLLPQWGGHAYAALLLLVGSPSARTVKRWIRLLSISTGFGYTLYFISFSDMSETTAVTAIPVIVVLLGLIGISCRSELAHKERRRRTRRREEERRMESGSVYH